MWGVGGGTGVEGVFSGVLGGFLADVWAARGLEGLDRGIFLEGGGWEWHRDG